MSGVGSFPLLDCPSLFPFPSCKGSSCSQGAQTVKNFIHNRGQINRNDFFSFSKPFLSLQRCQDTTGGDNQDPTGAEGAGGAGTSLPAWPGIPDLGFSAAETEHFLTDCVKTSRKRDLSINPHSNSFGHWRQPQIPFWNRCSKIPQNKRVLRRETAENTWFLTTSGK